MKQVLMNALGATLIGDNEKLKEANNALSEMAQQPGYCMTLMEIIDDGSLNVPIKQAGLIQLKNTIKAKWKCKTESLQMSQDEKISIRNSLITAVCRCAQHPLLIKIYREIISTVIGYEYENWIPIEEIIGKLHKNEDVVPIFHCILGICTNF